MGFFGKKARRFFRRVKAAFLELAVCVIILFLVTLAICFVLSLPEIIGGLIFGF